MSPTKEKTKDTAIGKAPIEELQLDTVIDLPKYGIAGSPPHGNGVAGAPHYGEAGSPAGAESENWKTPEVQAAILAQLEVGGVLDRLRAVEAQIEELTTIRETQPVHDPGPAPVSGSGIDATMVGGMFNCPECGLRIDGPSLTAIQGSMSSNYAHPFGDSPKLSGQKCRLIGQKFKSPIVHLEFVNPAGLTGAK